MKIEINRNAMDNAIDKLTDDIIKTAIEKASLGLSSFDYHYDYSRFTGNSNRIIRIVREKTEETVCCMNRGNYSSIGGYIKFYIKEA